MDTRGLQTLCCRIQMRPQVLRACTAEEVT